MGILLTGTSIFLLLLSFFLWTETKASVFPAMGFSDKEEPLEKTEFGVWKRWTRN